MKKVPSTLLKLPLALSSNVHAFSVIKKYCQMHIFGLHTFSPLRIVESDPSEDLRRDSSSSHGDHAVGEDVRAIFGKGILKKTLESLHMPNEQDAKADSYVYASLLQVCGSMKATGEGIGVHSRIIKTGLEANTLLQNHLVRMYCKFGCLVSARQVFDKISERNVVSWTAMIAGYARHGHSVEALGLFWEMQQVGTRPNQFTFGSVLRACAFSEALRQGNHVHVHAIKSGFQFNLFVGSALVDMYSKCRTLEDARRVFDRMPKRDVVSWNTMIAGYAQNGHGEDTLKLFWSMQCGRMKADQVTFTSVLKGCTSLGDLEHGKQIHASCIVQAVLDSDICVGNALTDMYAKCRSLEDARKVFTRMDRRDVVSWNTMISGYVQNEHGEVALDLFDQMQLAGMKPNQLTFAIILRACATLVSLRQGQQVHAHVISHGFESDISAASALIDIYAKCGSITDACKVFNKIKKHDIILWNEMMTGYAQRGHAVEAQKLFLQLKSLGMKPNQFTFASFLRGCASLTALEQGKQVHVDIIKCKYESDIFVRSALIDIYAKCGSIDDARKLFDKKLKQDVVSWSGMISGYAHHGHGEEALQLFCQMQGAGTRPDHFTFGSVLKACASLAVLEQSKWIHAYIIKFGLGMNALVRSALVDMYAKCGSIEDACKVFNNMHICDVVLCNAMITGFSQHGCGKEALQLYEQMQREGIKPNHITLLGVLSACRNLGLVDEGWHCFNSISQYHGIMLTAEHYSCMIDLLGRAGYLDEAADFINNMPFEPGPVLWRTLLGACRLHGNVTLGKHAADHVLELEPQNDATYVLLSNIYAAAGSWENVARVRKLMKARKVKKESGQSWISVRDRVHSFVAGDRCHPQMEEICAKLGQLTGEIKRAGYVPNTSFVLYNVDRETREHSLGYHGETGYCFWSY